MGDWPVPLGSSDGEVAEVFYLGAAWLSVYLSSRGETKPCLEVGEKKKKALGAQ